MLRRKRPPRLSVFRETAVYDNDAELFTESRLTPVIDTGYHFNE